MTALALALSSAAAPPALPPHAGPPVEAVFDCNENGVEDAVDIATGTSGDSNENGIPDECESRVE